MGRDGAPAEAARFNNGQEPIVEMSYSLDAPDGAPNPHCEILSRVSQASV